MSALVSATAAAHAEPVSFAFVRGKMIAPVTIAGWRARAVIDTGASRTLVDRRMADAIGVPEGRAIMVRDYVGAPLETRAAPALPLRLGDVEAETTPLIADLAALRRYGEDVAIVLGNDVLATRLISIDFDRSEIDFDPPAALSGRRTADAIPLTRRANHSWDILVRVAGLGVLPATIDLGSDAALSLAAPANLRSRLLDRQEGSVFRAAGLSSQFNVVQVDAATLDVAGAQFASAPVALLPAAPKLQASLGLAVLQRFNLVLDLAHDRLWATPNSRFELSFERPVLGFSTDAGGRVVSVDPGGPASAAGLRANDRVLAMYDVNRQPVQDTSLLEPGATVSLLLSTGTALSLTASHD